MEGHRRYCLADIISLGFRTRKAASKTGKSIKDWYIALLWGWYEKGKAHSKVQSMPITLPFEVEDRRYNTNTQFQRIFRIFNGDKIVEGPLEYQKFTLATREFLHTNPVNFLISWMIKDDKHTIRWITLCERCEYMPVAFSWPPNWLNKAVENNPKAVTSVKETPTNRNIRAGIFSTPSVAGKKIPANIEVKTDTEVQKIDPVTQKMMEEEWAYIQKKEEERYRELLPEEDSGAN